uniref:Molybdopterin synthase sulfur carrier subunit n=2 Tax=Psittaciformes TaxID=9223 RepID=A0A672TQQ1_STRHB
ETPPLVPFLCAPSDSRGTPQSLSALKKKQPQPPKPSAGKALPHSGLVSVGCFGIFGEVNVQQRCFPSVGPAPLTAFVPGQVSVLYFARSAELAGLRSETLSVPRQITALQLWEEIVKVHPRLAVIRDQVVFAVRQEYVLLGDQLLVLQPGDEVAIIPPISGG